MISEDILNLNESELNSGIWNIIDRYKNNYKFLKQEYQGYNIIRLLLDKFEKKMIYFDLNIVVMKDILTVFRLYNQKNIRLLYFVLIIKYSYVYNWRFNL